MELRFGPSVHAHIAAVFNYMSIILRCLSHRTPASSSSWRRQCSVNKQLFILGLCSVQDPMLCSLNKVNCSDPSEMME